MLKKLSEMPGEGALALLREEDWNATRRQRKALKLGGPVTAAVGMGLMVSLWVLVRERPVFLCEFVFHNLSCWSQWHRRDQ